MKRTAVNAFIFILVAVCVLSCALPSFSMTDTEHDCVGDGCLLCIISAVSSVLSERLHLTAALFVSLTLLLRCGIFAAHSAKGTISRETPVFLKVKLLN